MTNKLLVVGSVPTTPSIFEVILECQNMPETALDRTQTGQWPASFGSECIRLSTQACNGCKQLDLKDSLQLF